MANGITIVGDFSVPDFFADEATMFDLVNGTVRIAFAVVKPEKPVPPSEQALVVTGRLILPIASAQRLSLALHDYLMKHGLDPSASVRGDETPQ